MPFLTGKRSAREAEVIGGIAEFDGLLAGVRQVIETDDIAEFEDLLAGVRQVIETEATGRFRLTDSGVLAAVAAGIGAAAGVPTVATAIVLDLWGDEAGNLLLWGDEAGSLLLWGDEA